MDTRFWDDRYSGSERLFSGRPNGVLVAEVTGLPPGQALDVGCGEGADARWLAGQGWQVTAIDISRVALERAAADSADVDGRISWTRADLATTAPPAAAFDLVSAQYFPLRREAGDRALRGLLASVAPGGTLLFVGHDLRGLEQHRERGIDPGDYYQPGDVADVLGDEWTVLVNETRPRTVPAPPGSGHTHDTVLRARRRS